MSIYDDGEMFDLIMFNKEHREKYFYFGGYYVCRVSTCGNNRDCRHLTLYLRS